MTTDERAELKAALKLSYEKQNALLTMLEVLMTHFAGKEASTARDDRNDPTPLRSLACGA